MGEPSNKSWYEIRNSANGETEIAIMDEIGGWGVSARQFRQDLNRIGENEGIHLRIHSPGGSITEGNEIYNALKEHKGAVRVTIGAQCASMATVIAMAGKPIEMAENGFFMIHNPWIYASGDSDELRKMADIMEKMKGSIISAYAAKTGKGEKELSAMMDEETWMTADEALENGFIDKVISAEKDDTLKNFDYSRFKNSAAFFSKLQARNGASASSGADGNIAPAVTLRVLETTKTHNVTPQNKTTKMSTEIDNASVQAEAKKLYLARVARDKEIDDLTASVLDRDKKDFTALAIEFKSKEDSTVGDFAAAMAKSKNFKQAEVVGSGAEIEVTEPLDMMKGTPGFDFVNSEQGRAVIAQWGRNGRHSFSATITAPTFRNTQTSTGLTSIQYQPGVYKLGVRRLTIKEIIAAGATNNTTIRYRQENAFQNDAAAVTETGTLAQLQVSYQEVDAPVKDIGGYIEMSENLLADYLAIASFINERVPYDVERAVEDQLLNGSGSGANITGILQTSGIQTQAKGADTAVDAIHKAVTNVRFVPNAVQANAQGGYEPDAVVINPTDWQTIRLSKDANNQYFGGGPFTGAYGNGGYSNVYMLWGLPVVVTPAISAGTALVGAFRQASQYFQRQGLTLEMTNSNGTNFIQRIVTLRAAERLALAVYLPNAFCKVTGL